eukprot:TRINITY_DN559_c0_g1_i3.p6 TRINITY_DN559_c0_g1~~TRINITY_DN559_c0_g1_i3.p6  ORF type:complete len:305 (+),score=71.51 TRINITY_DN559_c0_g1_i3:4062-4976(+)
MPLARSRQGRVVCCNCRADVVTQLPRALPLSLPAPTPNGEAPRTDVDHEHAADGPTTIAAAAAATEATGAATIDRASRAQPSRADDTLEAANNTTRSGAEAVSTALGDKLLEGWTMLSSACSTCGTPLMRDPRNGNVLCVVCPTQPQANENVEEEDGAAILRRASRELSVSRLEATPASDARLETSLVQVERNADRRRVGSSRAHAEQNNTRLRRATLGGVENAQLARLSGTDTGGANAESLCVDDELRLAEEEAARALRSVRQRVGTVRDVEALRACLAAMKEACDAVRAARAARALPTTRLL